jgi:hypothetical protein
MSKRILYFPKAGEGSWMNKNGIQLRDKCEDHGVKTDTVERAFNLGVFVTKIEMKGLNELKTVCTQFEEKISSKISSLTALSLRQCLTLLEI